MKPNGVYLAIAAVGKWAVRQKGASLPVTLQVQGGDEAGIGKCMPDDHASCAGAYPWYPFADPGGIPKTLEWKRKVKLDRGQGTAFKATLGPVQQTPGKQQE